MEKQENHDMIDIRNRDTKQLCAVIREEGAEELAWATMLPGSPHNGCSKVCPDAAVRP